MPSRRKEPLAPHPAPGKLRLVQAFVNTRDPHAGTDELATPQGLAAWMARWGLATAGEPVSSATLENARQVREGVRAMLRAHNRGKVDPEVLEHLNRALSANRPQFVFERDASARLQSPEAGWPMAVGKILDGVFAAMTSGRWKRFKACYEDSCQMAFYDASKNLMGKWCTVRRCGNRANARAYRRRKPVWQRGWP